MATARKLTIPDIVAHRGASHDAPENTLAAFNLAWQQDADAIETDIWMTLDGKLACIHDNTTERTSAKKLKVTATTLAQLQQLDVGLWKGKQWKGERIPALSEALETVPKDRKILVEVKGGPPLVAPLINVIQDSPLTNDQIIVISFDKEVISEIKSVRPNLKAFLLISFGRDIHSGSWRPSQANLLKTLKEIKADGLDASTADCVNPSYVKAVHDAGFEFHVWTINDEALAARYCNFGIDSITTNRPKAIREFISSNKTDSPFPPPAKQGRDRSGMAAS